MFSGFFLKQKIWVIPALSLWLITACAYPISQKYRQEVPKGLTFSLVIENPLANVGATVIWGGRIIKTETEKNTYQVYILQVPLNNNGFPKDVPSSEGRFIVRSRYLDPEIFWKGRPVTMAGEIVGAETKLLDKTEYTYPVLNIKQLVLWQRKNRIPFDYTHDWGYYRYWYTYRNNPDLDRPKEEDFEDLEDFY